MPMKLWLFWAVLLIAQNFSFTFVSRARNSGSLSRHIKAAMASNGIWFTSQIFATGAFLKIISGEFGWGKAIFAGIFYTTFTILGSIWAHHHALQTEKGDKAVGANKKFKQILVEDYERIIKAVEHFEQNVVAKVENAI